MNTDITPDLEGLLEQVRRQQEEVMRIQRSVEALELEGSSRENEVTVTLRGAGRFTSVSIDPQAHRRYDAHELGEIVLEAVNDGLLKLAEATKARFAPLVEPAGA